MPASPIAVISFDLAPIFEIETKVPTIEKGCQEISSDVACKLSSAGWQGARGDRGLATLRRKPFSPDGSGSNSCLIEVFEEL